MWKFHSSALIIYVSGFFALPLYYALKGRAEDLVIPLTLVLYLLYHLQAIQCLLERYNDSSFYRWVLLAFSYQFNFLLIPAIDALKSKLDPLNHKVLISRAF
jgi:hypothetical protein